MNYKFTLTTCFAGIFASFLTTNWAAGMEDSNWEPWAYGQAKKFPELVGELPPSYSHCEWTADSNAFLVSWTLDHVCESLFLGSLFH